MDRSGAGRGDWRQPDCLLIWLGRRLLPVLLGLRRVRPAGGAGDGLRRARCIPDRALGYLPLELKVRRSCTQLSSPDISRTPAQCGAGLSAAHATPASLAGTHWLRTRWTCWPVDRSCSTMYTFQKKLHLCGICGTVTCRQFTVDSGVPTIQPVYRKSMLYSPKSYEYCADSPPKLVLANE
jgi:hypothetical protein